MKTKSSIWLSICTFVLCLGVMFTGIYSALSANLSMNGMLGFNMHNAMVTVTGTVKNLAEIPQGQNYANKIDRPIERTIMGGEGTTTASLSLGDMYFFQYDKSSVYDIIIELSFTNISQTAIQATIPAPTVGSGVTLLHNTGDYTNFSTNYTPVITKNSTVTVKFALKLDSLDSLSNNVDFSWNNITFEECEDPISEGALNILSNGCDIQITGTKKGYATADSYQQTETALTFSEQSSLSFTEYTNTSVDIGTYEFDSSDPENIPDIELAFTVQNNSQNAMTLAVVFDDLEDVAISTTSSEAIIVDPSSTQTITLTHKSLNKKENIYLSDLNVTILCNDVTDESEFIDEANNMHFYKNDAGTAWSVGPYTETATGKVEIPQYVEYLPVTMLVDSAIPEAEFVLPDYYGFDVDRSNAVDEDIRDYWDSMKEDYGYTTDEQMYIYLWYDWFNDPEYAMDLSGIVITPNENSKVYIIDGANDQDFMDMFSSLKEYGFTDTQSILAFSGISGMTVEDVLSNLVGEGNYSATKYEPQAQLSTQTTQNTRSIEDAYYYMNTEITELHLPNTTTIMPYETINSVYTLTTINIPGSVSEIETSVFEENQHLKNVTICNGVTRIGACAFYYAALKSITISNSVTIIEEGAFDDCISLTNVTMGNNVETIEEKAFFNCSGLTSITIPDSVTSIGSSAFDGCSGLTGTLTIPDSVTSIGDRAFGGCSGFNSIIVSTTNTNYDSRNNCNAIIETASNTLILGCKNSTIPNTVIEIGRWAFLNCYGLTSITIPDSVTSIGSDAFFNCHKLVEVVNKSNLTLKIGSSNHGKVACYAKQVITSESESKLITDSDGFVIYDGTILVGYTGDKTDITIPDEITEINQYAFYDCDGLTSVTIGNSVETIGSYAFDGCSGLTGTLTIPDSVTSIGSAAFSNCRGLTSITIPDSVTSIGDYAFNSCGGLTSVTIGNSVTRIGSYAFNNCSGLTSVTLGNSVTSIGSYAFYYCDGLTSVYIDGATTLSNAVKNYSITYIFKYTTEVYIQKDVVLPSGHKFTKQGTTVYTVDGVQYYKYTETY